MAALTHIHQFDDFIKEAGASADLDYYARTKAEKLRFKELPVGGKVIMVFHEPTARENHLQVLTALTAWKKTAAFNKPGVGADEFSDGDLSAASNSDSGEDDDDNDPAEESKENKLVSKFRLDHPLEYFFVRAPKGKYYFKRFKAYRELLPGKTAKFVLEINGRRKKYKAAPLNHSLIRDKWGGIWLGTAIHDGNWHIVVKNAQNSDKFDEYKAKAKADKWLFDPTNKQELVIAGNYKNKSKVHRKEGGGGKRQGVTS